MSKTYRTIVTNALKELNIIDAEDDPSAADAVYALGKLNRLIDRWNGRGVATYATKFDTYVLVPSLQPHTFGFSSATYPLLTRPEQIHGITLVYSGGARVPLRPRDETWWLHESSREMTGYPTDYFYSPTWPNGSLYLWPVPSGAYSIEIATDQLFAIDNSFDVLFAFPPIFEDAITLSLAEQLIVPFGVKLDPSQLGILRESAAGARAQLFANHGKRYPLRSDYGGRGAFFDYRTRSIS